MYLFQYWLTTHREVVSYFMEFTFTMWNLLFQLTNFMIDQEISKHE
jgi:hypothetical protein